MLTVMEPNTQNNDDDSKNDAEDKGKICRLCLGNEANVNIFEDVIFVDKILSFCKLEIVENDGLPDHTCWPCLNALEIAFNFKIQCEQSDKTLRRNLTLCNENASNNKEPAVKEECLSESELPNYYSDDFNSADDLKPLKLRSKKLKQSIEIGINGHKVKRKKKSTLKKHSKRIKLKADFESYLKDENSQDGETGKKQRKTSSKSCLCPFCGKVCLKRHALNAHIKTHRTDRPFSCDICGKNFTEKCHLHEHKKIHVNTKNYPCEVCGKLFKTSRDAKRHMENVHKKSRVVKCLLCKKELSSSSGLKLHMKTHTGEKDFQCDVCAKKFISKPCLMLHLRIHTGEKPYACHFCEGRFSILKTLKEHERIHTGETPYNCPLCMKGFSQRSNMKSHFRYNHKGVDFNTLAENNN